MSEAVVAALLAASAAVPAAAPTDPARRAREILDAAGVKGGLIVHLGCGDGRLTAALRASGSYLVHGLDVGGANIERARRSLGALRGRGGVSVSGFDGKRLPFADNVVNLVVSEGPTNVPTAEVLRVLAPLGVALIDGHKTVKPRPQGIDEWTHYLHDASNNAVAHDTVIGPPRHLQWQCGPRWSRHHDHMASVSALVAAGTRVFYILDEGSRVSPQLPADWKLIARDAFNGTRLWKRPIERWHSHLWPLKSGPASLPRRLVAQGRRVYATLGIDAPVTALDAASGETVRTYDQTAGAEEIVLAGGTLLVLVNRTPVDLEADLKADAEQGKSRDSRTTYSPHMARIWAGIRSRRWSHGERVLRAFDAATGRALWQRAGTVIPLTLAADAERAYYHDGNEIVALDRTTGKEAWRSERAPVWQGLRGRGLQSWFAPTLLVHDGKVLLAGGEKMHMSYMGWGSKDIGQDTMTAFSAETGRKLWTAAHPYCGYNSPEDLLVAGGKVWAGKTAKGGDGRYVGHDPQTGKVVADFPPTVKTFWFHHRCHRAKATDRYVLCSRTGIEFVDLKTGRWTIHHWVRGGCLYGIMPCNGLIYAPQHPCACYSEAKLYGFVALAPARPSRAVPKTLPPRLEPGSASSSIGNRKSPIGNLAWPTYRHDPARSGATPSAAPARLKPAWQATIGGRLTPPVAAGGLVLVADVDAHAVHALDAASGKKKWTYLAGGRVDSPPTYHRGRVLFGSADGYVTALRASDGERLWRFRAAPVDRRLVAFDEVESLWPVHGSVLVQDGVAWVVAGRSMYLDGGLRLCRLNAATGELLGEKVLDRRDPKTGEDLQTRVRGLNMPVALPDILASDGKSVYMRSQAMDLEGNRLTLGPGNAGPDHLFAPYGFTDDSWFHRVYWLFGNGFQGGIGGYGNGRKKPAGRILVHDGSTVFGYGRKPSYYRWSSVLDYHLFAAPRLGGEGGAAAAGAPNGVFFSNSASLDPTGKPLTIAAWVRPAAPDGTILVRGANLNGFALILTGGKPRMLLRTKGKAHEAVAAKAVGDGWTHVAGVLHEDGRMAVYVGGESAGTAGNVPRLAGQPSIAMKVGLDDTHQLLPEPLAPFRGGLDEVILFHRALAPGEVRLLAERGRKLDTKQREQLVLHLDFTGGKTRDRSACGNHGRFESGKARTVKGPAGEALLLEQPTRISAAKRQRRTARRRTAVAYRWTRDLPLMVRAMVLAGSAGPGPAAKPATGGTLFIAGPEDILDEVAAFQQYTDPAVQKRLAEQAAALAGKRGGLLHAVDADTGKTLAKHKIESPPVFDGLIAAYERLFLCTMDGRVICLTGAK